MTQVQNIVLVHGAFVDGSGWRGVYDQLTADGFNVRVTQHSTAALDSDVAAVTSVLDELDGPAILVGHSYGGVIITEAGRHDGVAGLVYVAAFAPDQGESVGALTANPEPGAPQPPIVPRDGALYLDRTKFPAAFAADIDPAEAAFMADAQLGWGLAALAGEVGEPAWRSKPSWYLLATEDQTIPPAAQHAMSGRAGATVVEQAGSHAVYISHPDVTADVIRTAASEALAAA